MSKYLSIEAYTQHYAEKSQELTKSREITLATLLIGLGDYDKASSIIKSVPESHYSIYLLSLIEELKGNTDEAMALRMKAAKAGSPESLMLLLPMAESLPEWRRVEETTQSIVSLTSNDDNLYLINQFAEFNNPAEEVDSSVIASAKEAIKKQKTCCSDILSKIRGYKAELEAIWQERENQTSIKSEAAALVRARSVAMEAAKIAAKAVVATSNHAKSAGVYKSQASLSLAKAMNQAKLEAATSEALKHANIATNMAAKATELIQVARTKNKAVIAAKDKALTAAIAEETIAAAQLAKQEAKAAEEVASEARNAAEAAQDAAQKAEACVHKAIASARTRALTNRKKIWSKLYTFSQYGHSGIWMFALIFITICSYFTRSSMCSNIELTLMSVACMAVYVIRLELLINRSDTVTCSRVSSPLSGVCSLIFDFLWLPLFAAPAFALYETSMSEVGWMSDIADFSASLVCIIVVGVALLLGSEDNKIGTAIVSVFLLWLIKYVITYFNILSSNGCLCLPLFLLIMGCYISVLVYLVSPNEKIFTPTVNLVLIRPVTALFFAYLTGLLLGKFGNPVYMLTVAYETMYKVLTTL